MTAWAEFAALLLLITAATPLLGRYIADVFGGQRTLLHRVLGPVERGVYAICRIDAHREMRWTTYFGAIIAFTVVSGAALDAMLLWQHALPLNPQHAPGMTWLVALNVAVSFATTTNWQPYAGETAMGYLAQMAGLAWQNFVAAAVGIAVAVALIRALSRSRQETIGNFWVDLTRSWLYVLLPLSIVGAVVLLWQGTPQNLSPYTNVTTMEGGHQVLTGGLVASQEIIKQLGVNGGGYVSANSAAPIENPTPLTDFLQMFAMFLIGAALTNTFGRLIGDVRQGWTLFAVMAVLFVGGFGVVWGAEHAGNPAIHQLAVAGPSLEGKEVRFGDAASALSVTVATDTSSGAANVAYDSLMPVSILIALANMQIGEIVFGGAGSGLYGIVLLAIVTVFVASLMIGRAPEYLGKKIERREMTLVVLASLVAPLTMLVPAAIAVLPGLSAVGNAGPRALSEIIYAFTSVSANNGSAMGGLSVQTDLYNAITLVVMLLGRFGTLALALAVAGGLARKPRNTKPHGSLSTATPMFALLLAATAITVTALTFVPADALGPVAESLLSNALRMF